MKATGIFNKVKYIISVDEKQNNDIHITKGFYGLLDVRYKSIEILKNTLDKRILKLITKTK
tara:strand:- start:238 stop:420 length:183 start_codon:yes stop_codon:yes gene_type:complete